MNHNRIPKRRQKVIFLMVFLWSLLLVDMPAVFCGDEPLGPADVDRDGKYTLEDIEAVLMAMSAEKPDRAADVDKDGKVDKTDLDLVVDAYQKAMTPEAKTD